MDLNPNRLIYQSNYSGKNLALTATAPYDLNMINLRKKYLNEYGYDRDVMDLCCGSGAYLFPAIDKFKNAIGLDFSRNLLNELKSEALSHKVENLKIIEGDATEIPLVDDCLDFIFSYTALYYVPHLDKVLSEVSRILRKGGVAVLELGNHWSLNTLVCNVQHREKGWAKHYTLSLTEIRDQIDAASLEIVEWRSFQLLPMYGAPLQLVWLCPLLSPFWKKLLGVTINGRMLDEWISSLWPFRYLAFRHIVVLRKI